MHIPFEIVHTIELEDGSKELYLDIAPSRQVLLGYLLEGLDGYCYHTITANPLPDKKQSKLLKITVVPDYYEELMELLTTLSG